MRFRDIDKMTDEEMKRKLMSAELKKRRVLGCLSIPIIICLILVLIMMGVWFFSFLTNLDEISESLDQTSKYGVSAPEVVTDYYKFG